MFVDVKMIYRNGINEYNSIKLSEFFSHVRTATASDHIYKTSSGVSTPTFNLCVRRLSVYEIYILHSSVRVSVPDRPTAGKRQTIEIQYVFEAEKYFFLDCCFIQRTVC